MIDMIEPSSNPLGALSAGLMSRPNLSNLRALSTLSTSSTDALAMRRRLPFAEDRPALRPRNDQEQEGWEMPEHWTERKKSDFRAAMANLSNFRGEIEYEVRPLEEGESTIDPDRASMDWGDASEVHKRAFGKALRLYHNENPDVVMQRVKGVLQHPTVEYETLLYAPHQWEQLFDQREPWVVEVESREDEGVVVMRLSKE